MSSSILVGVICYFISLAYQFQTCVSKQKSFFVLSGYKTVDIFTYHPQAINPKNVGAEQAPPPRWTVLTRDLFPYDFLDFIWSAKVSMQDELIRPAYKAVGFKSFPEHWTDVRNEHVWQEAILEDLRVKKIVLYRKDELAVYVSQLRADETGRYMTYGYPEDLTFTIDPAHFQSFLDRYRHTFRKKYQSPIAQRDTFWINYEDLCDEEAFRENIYPHLCEFLGVSGTAKMKLLRETVKQAKPDGDISKVIANYDDLEFCFRHSDVYHFAKTRDGCEATTGNHTNIPREELAPFKALDHETWSVLLPICSRTVSRQVQSRHTSNQSASSFNSNRFSELTKSSQYTGVVTADTSCWELLHGFCESLKKSATPSQLERFECIVGIDIDDPIYQSHKDRVKAMIPCKVVFVDIQPDMYGKLCRIWNRLATHSSNDYIVLFGDDVRLLDPDWSKKISTRFHEISNQTGLPLGAAVVAFNDLAFPPDSQRFQLFIDGTSRALVHSSQSSLSTKAGIHFCTSCIQGLVHLAGKCHVHLKILSEVSLFFHLRSHTQ